MKQTSLHSLFYVSGVAKVGHVTREHIITSRPWVPMKNSDNLEPKIYRGVFPSKEKHAAGGYVKQLHDSSITMPRHSIDYVPCFVMQFGGSDIFLSFTHNNIRLPKPIYLYTVLASGLRMRTSVRTGTRTQEGRSEHQKKKLYLIIWQGPSLSQAPPYSQLSFTEAFLQVRAQIQHYEMENSLETTIQPKPYCSISRPSIPSESIFF